MKPKGIILFHGAGGNRDHQVFLEIEGVSKIPILRHNFIYRQTDRKRPPPRVHKLVDEIFEVSANFASKIGVSQSSLVVGGRSLGGRAASMAVANGLPSRGLALLSYPLHPPGKQDSLRIDHLHKICRPTIFISGDRDPFGSPALLRQYANRITSEVSFHTLEKQNHDPKEYATIAKLISNWLAVLR
jgi:predicted alpha/beta-hydrolase family hydrolase